jgi:hypothetical protein
VYISHVSLIIGKTVRNPASEFLVLALKSKKTVGSYVNVQILPDSRKSNALIAGLHVSPACPSENTNI